MKLTHHIGFTGTRRAPTPAQSREIRAILTRLRPSESGSTGFFHHGDCLGSDAVAHDIAEDLGYVVIVHPPLDDTLRAFKRGSVLLRPEPHLKRNRAIVEVAELLLATPFEETEQPKGGTWYTVRHARRVGKPHIVILPDGSHLHGMQAHEVPQANGIGLRLVVG